MRLSIENKPNGPLEWPSDKLTRKQQIRLWDIVDEYVNTMIRPYVDDDNEDLIPDAAGALYEFAAWVLYK